MSLKAKLEAVIYAAEEPVTLAQLAALFAAEALEWKAEQEAAARAAEESRNEEAPAAAAAELPLTAELPLPMTETPQGETDAEAAEAGAPAGEATESVVEALQSESEAQGSGEPMGAEPASELAQEGAERDSASAEAEARRAARQREREVRAILRGLLDEIIASYAADNRGVEVREIAGGFRMATKPECHDAVRLFVRSLKPPLKLSLPALETLAVVAYKQPVTAPEVNEIRGVDSSGVFGSLLARKLIATAGRKPVIGRPILYKTTREFLLRFGLKDISELPSMEEFEKMAASELEEIEPAGAESNHAGFSESAAPELDETAGEDAGDASAAGSHPALQADSAPQPPGQSPQTQNESNPSETAPLHADTSAE